MHTRRQTLSLLFAGSAACALGFKPNVAHALSMTSPLKHMITGVSSKGAAKLKVTDISGNRRSLSHYRGRFVVVNVWATWCFPCRVEMPDLDSLQRHFDPNQLLVMPVSIDRRGIAAVRPFYKRTNITNLSIYTATGVGAVQAFGERGIPFTILLDPNGREFGRILGPVKWDADDFIAFLRDKIANWKA